MLDARPESGMERVGVVLGSQDATPLEFWVGVEPDKLLQLDDLVVVRVELPSAAGAASAAGPAGAAGSADTVAYYGIVDQVRKRFEGHSYDTDAFRAETGTMPVEISYAAHISVTRIDPEVFAPPHPGTPAYVVYGKAYESALYFDQMERKVPIGLTRTGEPIYANLEFLDGTRGAHVSISGVSGVATKTSYATFLLYSLFHSSAMGINDKAIIFNVKGEDLLWLDKPNRKLKDEARKGYERLGLVDPGPFRSVGLYAPARRGSQTLVADTGGRQQGVNPYVWTLREFAEKRLLRFAFADTEDARAQLAFVIYRVERELERAAVASRASDPDTSGLWLSGHHLRTFSDLVDLLDSEVLDEAVGSRIASGTLDAFRRRLHAAAQHMGHLIRSDRDSARHGIRWEDHQVTVVDIHTLHSLAQMFVVGVLLKGMMEAKELKGTSKPLVFVVLDELNKYAPRTGWSPIRDVLLDIAERGRSMGISLFGAQQTASEVERRVVANAALRVVGRLDSAEAQRNEYRWLSQPARLRAAMLQPGTMIVSQPEIPTPILVRFPFPSWATRRDEAEEPAIGGPRASGSAAGASSASVTSGDDLDADPFARMIDDED